jgi:poly-D-alanine transfer protein DltD
MPPNGENLHHIGVSKESLAFFPAHVRALAAQYGAQVEAFESHVEDPNFFSDYHDHLSAKGWMYYNRVLDEFYHADPALLEATFAKGPRKPLRGAATPGHS